MFRITCECGTSQTAWSWKTAMEWLACCGPRAEIKNRFTGKVLAARNTVRIGG